MVHTPPLNWMGLVISGDVGGLTVYTDRLGRKIGFPKAPPKEPPSVCQIVERNRFRDAMLNWVAISDDDKKAYEQITMRLSLMMNGHNLWVSISMIHDLDSLHTMMRQANVTTIDPPLV